MILTITQLNACMPFAGDRAAVFLECLNHGMLEFGIDTPVRQSAFLAQVAHESGSLRYTREIADGSAYEGRADLGNTHVGDGKKYPGRGLLQVTGRTNTETCLVSLGRAETDLEYLETPIGASRSAAWFWKLKGLNELADAERFGSITKAVNGGYNGLDERIRYYVNIRRILGA